MGLDFSYILYFKREALWDALQGVAAIARPSELPTLIVFPDHVLSLSIESWATKDRIFHYDDSEFGFMASIYFPEDGEITDYVKRLFPEYYEEMAKESPLGIPIGYIYLTVYNDLSSEVDEVLDPDVIAMEFGTTGTNMSLLFSDSASIRKRFIGLLEKFSGVCGVFNMETDGLVFWLNRRRMNENIGDPRMQPKEIENSLGKSQGV